EQLRYIPKVVLLRVYGDYIEHVWHKLPEHVKADSEVHAGINPLDAACWEHDIAYSRSNDLTDRHAADKVLADKALGRVVARDSVLSERASAAAIWAEQGRGLYLAPYKYGHGLYLGPYKRGQGVAAKKNKTPKRR
ncbi:hypothetical protein ALC57_00410, partial [Trachymyrmex cornetzi]